MNTLPGYEIEKEIYSGEKSLVYRGKKSNQLVIIKILQNEYPSGGELSGFKQEYEILRKIQVKSSRVVRVLGLEKYKNGLAILFEDMGGEAISRILADIQNMPQKEILNVLISSAKALGEIHAAGLVHKDIKSHNIVLNQKTGELQIIDFGNASYLSKQNSYTPLNSSLEGTLAYISPEQTGRMNRTIDYRTDYYSLGVTFYQILTGELPFVSSDPMELVHAHIAKMPVSPFEKNKSNKTISDIVMKLLQKNPEDRYQSIAGLVYDLEWCLENIDVVTRHAVSLHVGQKDFSGKFQIPEKLYGRAKEIQEIVNTFKNVATGNTELLLISGRSGIGKSALINEVNKPITEYKGYFASGKYDQFKRAIPYYAIGQTFQSLIQQILTGSQEDIVLWKGNLLKALGQNGQVVIDLIPELENLIGKQPAVPMLGASESQNRFNLVFQNFIQAFCTKEHPIAIFLDDLQWADNPSISLIQTILSNPEMKYLYLMLSFRDNEVLPTDSFSLMLENLKKTGFIYKEILLEPISVLDITHLVSDTLSCEESKAKELATILFEKTKGNPFFVNATFKSLYDKDLLEYKEGIWKWDLQKIRDVKISENVIDLMVERVKELSPNQIELLKLAACVGDSFPLETFFQLANQEIDVANRELTTISNEGFLLLTKNQVRFVHDKVREATYSLIGEEERAKKHYAIGVAYLKITKEEDVEENIFTIVNQLNQGIQLMSEEEKNRLIDLNILAGDKAFASAAYDTSLQLYRITMELLPENCWEILYKKTFEIYIKLARLEYLNGNYSESEKSFTIILNNAKTNLEKVTAYEIQMPMYAVQNKLREATNIGLKALELLGVHMPEVDDPMSEIMQAVELIGSRNMEDLLNIPIMNDVGKSSAMRILSPLIVTAYIGRPSLVPILILKMVNLSLEFGSHAYSPFSYAFYGVLLANVLGQVDAGFQFGKMSISLIEKLAAKQIRTSVLFIHASMINHWKRHASQNISIFKEAIEAAKEDGEFQYGSYAVNGINTQLLLMRKELSSIVKQLGNYHITISTTFRQPDATLLFELIAQFALNLTGDPNPKLAEGVKDLLSFDGEYFKEEKILSHWKETSNHACLYIYYTLKLEIHYLFGSVRDAYEYSRLGEQFEGGVLGMMWIPEHVFFDSLSCIILLDSLNPSTVDSSDNTKYSEQIQKNQGRMKVWAENSPANYGHKYYIIEAELARLAGNTDKALELYEQAIAIAKEHEYLLEEAIANELLAKFWLNKKKQVYADTHLFEAHYAYKKWGCEPKVKQLEEKYPKLKRHAISGSTYDPIISTGTSSMGTSTAGGSFLDLNTVVKASQALSGEIYLGRLLEKMMKILFENAGAERGFFILKEKDKLFIEAEGNANTGSISVLEEKPLEDNESLSSNIVNYVVRTKSIVLLNDAVKKGMFVNDEYVKTKQPKSILCYPVINQGNLIGVVYLENNLTTDAFTPDRVEILKILSSQIAVSVENSLLYANLEEKVEERTRDLNQALVEVRGLKEQQDGDYFLNTLLIEPLGQNNAFSKTVGIEFLVKQKKIFVFRRLEYELGGDINISENIELLGRKYILFLNGDAMGKSIQGAGGVLVLGTVFKSIIQRTASTNAGKSVYPERWLKNAFIEMHKAFESFDGSMLMSTVFGLIDELTGTLYFMNAEHPDIVLYRDGVASFIENPNQYRKLGTQGQTGSISIEVFSLRPDDILILGSDGRDDIVLGKDPNTGADIINQDEKLFLSHVKNGSGDLDRIYESIMSTGRIMDDLSLLRIHYKGVKLKEEKIDEDLKLLEDYREIGKLDKYIELGERVISNYPQLTNFLFEMSSTCKKLGQYEKAIDYGERLRLREPLNFENLINLIDSYNGIGKKERAKSLLDACLKVKPENERLQKLKLELN